MSVGTSALPGRLPDTAAIDAKAKAVRKVGTDCEDIRDDVQSHWSGLGAVFESPHQDKVYAAVTTVLSPPIDAVGTITDDTAKALEDFSSKIAGLKTRYDAVVARASSHNDLVGEDRPDDYWATNGEIQQEVRAVAELYDDAVSTCASKITQLNPLYGDGLKNANAAAGYGDHAISALEALGLTASSFEFRNGKLIFKFNSDSNDFKKRGMPGRFSIKEGTLKKLGVPKSYIDRLAESQKPKAQTRVSKNVGKSMLKNLDSGTPLGALVAKYPWLKNSKLSVQGQKVQMKVQLTRGSGSHKGGRHARTGPVKLPKALEKVNKFAKGPGGKLLNVAGAGMTFAGSYSEGYNDSVLRNPEMSAAEHRQEATKDATVVTAAEEVGAVVGTTVGRGVGAAVGQALIPIPGVGAAVGGFVGGLAGGWVGGQVGNAIGSTINDLRHGDIGSIGEAAKETGKKILKSLNPFG